MYRKKLLLAAVCVLLAVGLLVSGTLAWLSKSRPANGTFTVLSDFEVSGALTFGGSEVAYQGDSILAYVSFSPDAPNYIGKLKYTVQYTGASPALIRVRLLEQWTDLSFNEILPMSFLDYYVPQDGSAVRLAPPIPSTSPSSSPPTIPAAGPENGALAESGVWIDHRATDYCYYYSVPVQPKTLSANAAGAPMPETSGTVELTLIDQAFLAEHAGDLVDGIDPATTEMGLVIEVEAVQPNRYREFWGLDALPQPSLSP